MQLSQHTAQWLEAFGNIKQEKNCFISNHSDLKYLYKYKYISRWERVVVFFLQFESVSVARCFTYMTWKGQLGVWRNLSSLMERWGTVLRVDRHQHRSTRLMGFAANKHQQKKKNNLVALLAIENREEFRKMCVVLSTTRCLNLDFILLIVKQHQR